MCKINQFTESTKVIKAKVRKSKNNLWPNFFIVGAPRSGTTLNNYLKVIPGIYMSTKKEPNYFCKMTIPDDDFSKPIRKKEKYLGLFSEVKDETIRGEASVLYLSDPEAPKLIHRIAPNSRILISLRDPVARTYTAYLAKFLNRGLKGSFHDELQKTIENWESRDHRTFIAIWQSLYADDIKRYLDIFGTKQVKIIIFEEFIKNIKNTFEEILKFLEINQDISHLEFKTVHNPVRFSKSVMLKNLFNNNKVKKVMKIFPTLSRRYLEDKFLYSRNKPTMLKEDKETLVQFFSNDVKKLQKLLGRTIPWPNFVK